MSTEQRRSFIAEIKSEFEPLNFRTLDAADINYWGEMARLSLVPLNPATLIATELFSTIDKVPFLTTRYSAGVPEPGYLLAYFRCYGDYYNIQIRSADQSGKFLSKHSSGLLGAFPAAGGDTTSFNLLDKNGKIVTLDDIENDNVDLFFKARNAGVVRSLCNSKAHSRKTWSSIRTFNDTSGDESIFRLRILERNVPYPITNVALNIGDVSISAHNG